AKPVGSAAAMLSFWLERRVAIPPTSRERVPCCWPMVPMTTGASIPSNDPLALWPSPAYLPIAPASAVWSRPPSSDERSCDAFSISEDWPGDHVGKAAEGTGLLPCGVEEVLRSAGLRGNATEARQQPRYRCADSGLRVVAIKTKCRRDASDHIGCQELHNERDEIDGHGASPLSLNWEQTFPSGMQVSRRRKASDDCCARSFPEAMTNQRRRESAFSVLNLGDSCQGFHCPISGFSASTFREPPNSRLRPAGAVSQ